MTTFRICIFLYFLSYQLYRLVKLSFSKYHISRKTMGIIDFYLIKSKLSLLGIRFVCSDHPTIVQLHRPWSHQPLRIRPPRITLLHRQQLHPNQSPLLIPRSCPNWKECIWVDNLQLLKQVGSDLFFMIETPSFELCCIFQVTVFC